MMPNPNAMAADPDAVDAFVVVDEHGLIAGDLVRDLAVSRATAKVRRARLMQQDQTIHELQQAVTELTAECDMLKTALFAANGIQPAPEATPDSQMPTDLPNQDYDRSAPDGE